MLTLWAVTACISLLRTYLRIATKSLAKPATLPDEDELVDVEFLALAKEDEVGKFGVIVEVPTDVCELDSISPNKNILTSPGAS